MLGLVEHEHVASIIRSLAADDAESMLAVVEELVAQSRDLETVLLNLAETLHRVTLVQCVPGYRDDERSDWPAIQELAGSLSPEDAQLYYQIALRGRSELGQAPDPRTGLEMTLLRMLAFRPATAGANGSPQPSPTRPAIRESSSAAAGTRAAPAPAPNPAPRPGPAPTPPAETATPQPEPEQADDAPEPLPARGDDEWLTLIERLALTGQVRELARHVELQSRDENRWTFAIAPALKHLGSRICISRLEQALSAELGRELRIRIVEDGQAPARTVAAAEQEQQHQAMNDAEKAIAEDPTVQTLKEKMGARVVDDSIRPLQ
jgi:DNA polymerase-3 subunit gamma/tau